MSINIIIRLKQLGCICKNFKIRELQSKSSKQSVNLRMLKTIEFMLKLNSNTNFQNLENLILG